MTYRIAHRVDELTEVVEAAGKTLRSLSEKVVKQVERCASGRVHIRKIVRRIHSTERAVC